MGEGDDRDVSPASRTLSESENFFAEALKAFRFAAGSAHILDIEHHAGMGREYLSRAHRAAEVVDTRPERRLTDGNSDD
jgi:hypothetical protein